jgi:hypothetical protein
VSVRASGRGNPWISLSDGHDLITSYTGPEKLITTLQENQAAPLSMASADFDEDGVPDLICGYAAPDGSGIISLHRGNLDSIYPNSPEAQKRKVEGTFTQAPFLSPASVLSLPEAPNFVQAGDFDADGHWDIVAARKGGNKLYWTAGDGRGGFGPVRKIDLPGPALTMIAGEINRADGLTDVVVGIAGLGGPKVLVFEGPTGALKASPEEIKLPGEPTSLSLGRLTGEYTIDLAVAAGRDLVVIRGRDRMLSLDPVRRRSVKPPVVDRYGFTSPISCVAAGDFEGDGSCELASLSRDGSLRLLKFDRSTGAAGIKETWSGNPIGNGTMSGSRELVCARVSSLAVDNLLAVDPAAARLQVVLAGHTAGERTGTEFQAATSLDMQSGAVAALPMRLNGDALSDIMVLRIGSSTPAAILTQPQSVFSVTNTNDSGPGSFRQAILNANSSPGADLITFNIPGGGVPVISPLSPLPEITDPVTIDGTSQSGAGTASQMPSARHELARISPHNIARLQAEDSVVALTSGVPASDSIPKARGECVLGATQYTINVAPGASQLQVVVVSEFGRQEIFVRFGQPVDVQNGVVVADFASTDNHQRTAVTATETTSPQLQGGIYYIAVANCDSLGPLNYTVTATVSFGEMPLASGIPAPGTIGAAAQGQCLLGSPQYTFQVAQGVTQFTVGLAATDSIVMLIRFGQPVGFANGQPIADLVVNGGITAQTITLSGSSTPQLQQGTYYIAVANCSSNQQNFTLTAAALAEPSAPGAGLVQLDGSKYCAGGNCSTSGKCAGNVACVVPVLISGGNSVVRGLVVSNFDEGFPNLLYAVALKDHGGNVIEGNLFGTDPAGLRVESNSVSLFVNSSSGNKIGGTTRQARNVICAGRGGEGALLTSSNLNAIQGNYVGTDPSGTIAVSNPNDTNFGVGFSFNCSNNTIGGTVAGSANVFAGFNTGLELEPGNTIPAFPDQGNLIQGNFIGTDVTGTKALSNRVGILMSGDLPSNAVGGTTPAARNIISGNQLIGLSFLGFLDTSSGTEVQGNYIGADSSGMAPLPNGGQDPTSSGIDIAVFDAVQAGTHFGLGITIGGTAAGAGNVISGNNGYGIHMGIQTSQKEVGAQKVFVQGNYIGVNAGGNAAMANSLDGILVDAVSINNNIGGPTAQEGNLIAFNGGSGVRIPDNANPAVQIAILNNSIHSNMGLGIDLGPQGPTPNPHNVLTGANLLQNFPALSSARASSIDSVKSARVGPAAVSQIAGTLSAKPNTTYYLQFIFGSDCPGSGHQFLGTIPITVGSQSVTTDANGDGPFTFSFTLPAGATGGFVNSTATDPAGNTSEFSRCIQVTTDPSACITNCPNDQLAFATSQSGAVVNYETPTLSGACANASVSCMPSSGSVFPIGTTSVTCTTTLASGRTSSCVFSVVVVPPVGPAISEVFNSGKDLVVKGKNFDSGAVVLKNGDPLRTLHDGLNPTTTLIGRKAYKAISPGETVTIQVKNSDGSLSNQVGYTRPSSFRSSPPIRH